MARDFDFTPGVLGVSLRVDEEGAAFNTHVFFAVKFFQFDDIKKLTQFFVGVADEIEGKFEAGTGVVVAFETVA